MITPPHPTSPNQDFKVTPEILADRAKVSTFSAIVNAKCPVCHTGKISSGYFGMEKACPHCGYDLRQEEGYFLGAMMIGFFATAALTIPPVLFLKFAGFEDSIIIAYPFLQYLVLGPLLTYYAKIAWVHVGYHAGERMKRNARDRSRPRS